MTNLKLKALVLAVAPVAAMTVHAAPQGLPGGVPGFFIDGNADVCGNVGVTCSVLAADPNNPITGTDGFIQQRVDIGGESYIRTIIREGTVASVDGRFEDETWVKMTFNAPGSGNNGIAARNKIHSNVNDTDLNMGTTIFTGLAFGEVITDGYRDTIDITQTLANDLPGTSRINPDLTSDFYGRVVTDTTSTAVTTYSTAFDIDQVVNLDDGRAPVAADVDKNGTIDAGEEVLIGEGVLGFDLTQRSGAALLAGNVDLDGDGTLDAQWSAGTAAQDVFVTAAIPMGGLVDTNSDGVLDTASTQLFAHQYTTEADTLDDLLNRGAGFGSARMDGGDGLAVPVNLVDGGTNIEVWDWAGTNFQTWDDAGAKAAPKFGVTP